MKKFVLILCLSVVVGWGYPGQAEELAINEQFETLDAWIPITFPEIENHSEYDVVQIDGGTALKTSSKSSASGVRCIQEFNVYEYPVVRWRWKVDNVYEKGNLEEKAGDDYPLRVYIMFKYDPEKASFGEKVQYGLAKLIYGEYPPQSSLNYIWANRPHKKRIYSSTYTDRAQLVIVRAGSEDTGSWWEQEINILDDYMQAFGRQPPSYASIAIMNDSDNTGESAVSYMSYIQVLRSE